MALKDGAKGTWRVRHGPNERELKGTLRRFRVEGEKADRWEVVLDDIDDNFGPGRRHEAVGIVPGNVVD